MAKSTTTTKRSPSKSPASGKKAASKKSAQNGRSNGSEKEGKSGREELMKLFEHALKDIYWVEKSLTKSIPKMIRKASSDDLIEALEDHLEVTEDQVSKVERVFAAIDKAARGKKCVGMQGILDEGEELMKEFEKSPALDAAIIMAAQKVEHYEMSAYMGMITLAETLNFPKEAALLQEVLQQEMQADQLLAKLAANNVHQVAIAGK